jgi:hypothetical protein
MCWRGFFAGASCCAVRFARASGFAGGRCHGAGRLRPTSGQGILRTLLSNILKASGFFCMTKRINSVRNTRRWNQISANFVLKSGVLQISGIDPVVP